MSSLADFSEFLPKFFSIFASKSFRNRQHPRCIIDLDIPTSIREWRSNSPPTLPPSIEKSLHDLYDLCRKEAFTDTLLLEQKIGMDIEAWHQQALPHPAFQILRFAQDDRTNSVKPLPEVNRPVLAAS